MQLGKCARIVGLNCLWLGLGVLGLELLFGAWVVSRPLQLNIVRDTEYRFDVRDLYERDGPVVYRRDANGLRGLRGSVATIDLLTLGGSTTDQRYISEGETWQDVLRHRLQQQGKDIHIANAGIDGQSSAGVVANFSVWFPQVPSLRPRFVLLYNGINDLFTERSAYDDVEGRRTLKGMLRAKSALYRLYKNVQGALLAHAFYPVSHRAVDFASAQWTSEPQRQDHAELIAPRLAAYARNLRVIDRKIREWGAIPIFVTQPSRMSRFHDGKIWGVVNVIEYQRVLINGVDFHNLLSLINAETMDSCRALNGICLDLAHDLHFEEGDFYDYFHNTPAGTAKIGTYLFQRLREWL